TRFPLDADRHQASGNADVDPRRLKLRPGLGQILFQDLGNGVRGFIAIGVRQLPQRFNLLELFFAELVDFLVKWQGDSWSAASGEANSKRNPIIDCAAVFGVYGGGAQEDRKSRSLH